MPIKQLLSFWKTGVLTMVHGVGIDVVEVARFDRLLKRFGERALCRLFAAEERTEPLSSHRWAGRFAAKEAVLKVLGTGPGPVAWQDIRITLRPSGQPEVSLHGTALTLARDLGIGRVLVSIAHERQVAVAVAVGAGEVGGHGPCV